MKKLRTEAVVEKGVDFGNVDRLTLSVMVDGVPHRNYCDIEHLDPAASLQGLERLVEWYRKRIH
jgi:hypothetical protein